MRLSVSNFRKYREASWDFEPGQLIYIDGANGAGKTTIFLAISWTLYGKVTDVVNWLHPTEKMFCMLETDRIKIYRQHNKSSLQIQLSNGEELAGDAAQHVIDGIFGRFETWTSTCYYNENDYEFHPLLMDSAVNRAKLLNQLTQDRDDPTDYIKQLQLHTKEVDRLHNEAKIRYEVENKGYEKLLSDILPSEDWMLESDEREHRERLVPEISSSIRAARSAFEASSVRKGSYLQLSSNMKRVEHRLSQLPPADSLSEMLEERRKAFDRARKYNDLQVELGKVAGQISAIVLPPITDEQRAAYASITESDLSRIQHDEYTYEVHRNKAQKLGVTYETGQIVSEIRRCEMLLDRQNYLLHVKRRDALREMIKACRKSMPIVDLPRVEIVSRISALNADERERQIETQIQHATKEMADLSRQCEQTLALDIERETARLKRERGLKLDVQSQTFSTASDRLTSQLAEERERLKRINESRHLLTCPRCQLTVKIENGALHSADSAKTSDEDAESAASAVRNLELRLDQLKRDSFAETTRIRRDSESEIDSMRARLRNDSKVTSFAEDYHRLHILPLQKELDRLRIENQKRLAELHNMLNLSESLERALLLEASYLRELDHLTAICGEEDIPDTPLSVTEHADLKRRVSELMSIVVVSAPEHAVKTAKSILTERKLVEQKTSLIRRKEQLELEMTKYSGTCTVTAGELQEIKKRLVLRKQLDSEFDSIQSEMRALNYQPGEAERLKLECEELVERLNQLKLSLTQDTDARKVVAAYQNVMLLSEEEQRLQQELFDSTEMEHLALESQSIRHDRVMEMINVFLEDVSVRIFDDPIQLTLQSTKSLKSGVEKPCVNMQINYLGGMNVNVRSLSKAEKKRVSVLLSIALCLVVGNPLIILDEGMANLDRSKQHALLQLLSEKDPERRIIPNDVTVLVTCQECPLGKFDRTITL